MMLMVHQSEAVKKAGLALPEKILRTGWGHRNAGTRISWEDLLQSESVSRKGELCAVNYQVF